MLKETAKGEPTPHPSCEEGKGQPRGASGQARSCSGSGGPTGGATAEGGDSGRKLQLQKRELLLRGIHLFIGHLIDTKKMRLRG